MTNKLLQFFCYLVTVLIVKMRKIVKVYTVVKWCIWGDNLDRRRGRYRCSCVASRQPALYPWIMQHTAGTLPLDTAADSLNSPPGYCSRQPALSPWILQQTAGTLPLDTAADSRHSTTGYCIRQPAVYPWILQQTACTLPLDTAANSRQSTPGYCNRQPVLYPWILQQTAGTLPLDTAANSRHSTPGSCNYTAVTPCLASIQASEQQYTVCTVLYCNN